MSNATEITNANFDEITGRGVTLVDFWAEWCGPCKMIAPMIDELSTEFDGKANVGKVNVDNEAELAARFGVASIPTLLVIKDGEISKKFVGVTAKGELAAAITEATS